MSMCLIYISRSSLVVLIPIHFTFFILCLFFFFLVNFFLFLSFFFSSRRRHPRYWRDWSSDVCSSDLAAQWRGNFAMLANAAAWTAASTEWLKVVIRRKRPVLYTSGAAAAAADRESQQSFPSTHASLAFAAATSYLVLARRQHLRHRTRNAILLYAGAVGVSALRVAAGKHFPTDVAAGAALGSGIGWLVATIHPRVPGNQCGMRSAEFHVGE